MDIKLIAEKLDKSGLRRNWVAQHIGVHPSTLRRFLIGESELNVDALAKLLKLLNIKFESLFSKAA